MTSKTKQDAPCESSPLAMEPPTEFTTLGCLSYYRRSIPLGTNAWEDFLSPNSIDEADAFLNFTVAARAAAQQQAMREQQEAARLAHPVVDGPGWLIPDSEMPRYNAQ